MSENLTTCYRPTGPEELQLESNDQIVGLIEVVTSFGVD